MMLVSRHIRCKPDADHQPAAGCVAQLDLRMMYPGDLAHDSESESAAFHVLFRLAPVEPPEHCIALMRRNAGTIVDNLQQRVFFHPRNADRDDGTVACITDGVVDKI